MHHKFYTTQEFAEIINIKPNTVRHSLCLHGHYLGVVPIKLPNRRLLWHASKIDTLVGGVQS